MNDSKKQTLVSVITVVKNDAKGLIRTMDSVASQDYTFQHLPSAVRGRSVNHYVFNSSVEVLHPLP